MSDSAMSNADYVGGQSKASEREMQQVELLAKKLLKSIIRKSLDQGVEYGGVIFVHSTSRKLTYTG